MNLQFNRLVPALVFAATMTACGTTGHDSPELQPQNQTGGTGSTGTGGTTSGNSCNGDTWDNYAQNFFTTTCVTCHAAGSAHDASTYAAVQADSADVITQITSGAMPMGGSLAPMDKSRILNWLQCGMPESASSASDGNSTEGTAGPSTGGTTVAAGTSTGGTTSTGTGGTVSTGTGGTTSGTATSTGGTTTTTTGGTAQCTPDTYANYAQAFFTTNCVTCHGAGSAHDASTYAAIQAEATDAQADIQSGKMPLGTTLAAADKTRILKWFACKLPQ